ncbi:MAG TPA: glycosyl hydrolase [Solirubrobacterales bacterium]|nr:glycosyl hydrolase [Solirubrobacterales bacterium]
MSIGSKLARATGAVAVLLAFALALVAAPTSQAAGRIAVHKNRNLGTATCVKQRPAARAKRVARRVGQKGRCRRTRTVASSAPAPSLYWGTWAGSQFTGEEAPWDMSAVSRYESTVGKQLSLLHFSSPFANCSSSDCSYYPFPSQAMENIRGHGAIPFFSWASQALGGGLDQPDFQLSDVIAGDFDGYIQEFAEEAHSWGHPFFLRFNWEMNGDWFPWSEGVNGNNPGEYVAAWRHVHDIFNSVGATNATWVWCPNVDPGGKFLDLGSLYPGDEYVGWTCLDGYNWGTNPVSPRGWSTFDQLFEKTYRTITETIAPTKPMIIGEVGSTEVGGSKAGWIKEMVEALPVKYPRVRGVMWFDKWIEDMDWPLDSSSSATQAFAEAVQRPAYMANSYSSLAEGPVQPPA